MAINKIVPNFEEAVADIPDGATILIGGHGAAGGFPAYLTRALAKQGAKGLTIVSNTGGKGKEVIHKMAARSVMKYPSWYLEGDHGILVEEGRVRKVICSFAAMPSPLLVTPIEKKMKSGEVEVELVPQGTLAERIRAGKAGVLAFYVTVGRDTVVEQGKEVKVIDGQKCLLEYAIKGDFAFIWADKADRYGNLTYRGTSRTFNATMAGAARVTIAEVEEIVELGELGPEVIVTPGMYVDRVVQRPKGA